ncbi:ankyrin repeat-containing ITN1-like [Olea europaea subsp. europaea]|uniref:Ankyrin repeat-containing ITN1-like n=1 Tax=Olea europaea subsp. europaea TaxID=158383 RepID=A0A8S0RP66_OLEEU|nr:ankyrin repeat-containing ITN1-like [Olea europaea subsp. europaea]
MEMEIPQKGDLAAVKQTLDDINSQMMGTLSRADFDREDVETRASVVNEVNELGETALYAAAERGHMGVSQGHHGYYLSAVDLKYFRLSSLLMFSGIVLVLLDRDPGLIKTVGPSNATPLVTAASKGHTAVVNESLSKDCSLLEVSRSNGKNALHLTVKQGHVDIVKALLDKDPQLARRTDKKGQTALLMAVKGVNSEVVILLLEADAAIVMLPEKFGNMALHVATRKKHSKLLRQLCTRPSEKFSPCRLLMSYYACLIHT